VKGRSTEARRGGCDDGGFDVAALEIILGTLVDSFWTAERRPWRIAQPIPPILSPSLPLRALADFCLVHHRLRDAKTAKIIQLAMEDNPAPPFNSGHPSAADAHIVEEERRTRAQQLAAWAGAGHAGGADVVRITAVQINRDRHGGLAISGTIGRP
jgi:hypothetical protein